MMRRGRLEMINDMFMTIQAHPNFSQNQIISFSNFPQVFGKKILETACEKGFVTNKKDGRKNTFRLTEKGMRWSLKITPLIEEIRDVAESYDVKRGKNK